MDEKKYIFNPNYALHPGLHVIEMLETFGMKQSELSIRLGITPKHLTNLVGGKVSLTTEIAHDLQAVFSQPAEYWLALQANYDLNKLRLEQQQQYHSHQATYDHWLNQFDYDALVKQGIINDIKATGQSEKIRQLLNFFGCSDIESWYRMYDSDLPAACRISGMTASRNGNTLAWLRFGQLEANKIIPELPDYDRSLFRSTVRTIRSLTIQTGDVRSRIREACNLAGVCLIFSQEIPGTGLCGAAFWVGRRSTPCIQMSLRYKKSDQFWFTFFHEAAHIINEHKKTVFIDGCDSSNVEEESDANRIASDILIPSSEYQRFLAEKDFSVHAINEFAAAIKIHSGIVVGRLQHDKKIPWSWHNNLKESIKW
jgi:HTH-type transcriptional regulator / antitoxin HigA